MPVEAKERTQELCRWEWDNKIFLWFPPSSWKRPIRKSSSYSLNKSWQNSLNPLKAISHPVTAQVLHHRVAPPWTVSLKHRLHSRFHPDMPFHWILLWLQQLPGGNMIDTMTQTSLAYSCLNVSNLLFFKLILYSSWFNSFLGKGASYKNTLFFLTIHLPLVVHSFSKSSKVRPGIFGWGASRWDPWLGGTSPLKVRADESWTNASAQNWGQLSPGWSAFPRWMTTSAHHLSVLQSERPDEINTKQLKYCFRDTLGG